MKSKKMIVNTMVLPLVFGLLAGCGTTDGDMRDRGEDRVSASPMIVSPDPANGFTTDEDGVLSTDGPAASPMPGSASPSASASPANSGG
ncbi:MAG: hypothetical protein IKQ10_08445 [Oscillospiraceae bacterium]|nr:hypothetical protein [Oscillospiraceae bacterium]